jgi:serine/threonine protein kinase
MQEITVPDDVRCGELVGGSYILGEVLGTGGMGVVYGAVQCSLGRSVAVKMPRADIAMTDVVQSRFHTEAFVASRLWHRNIVAVIDFGYWNGTPFLVMERVQGQLLGKLVRTGGALEPKLAIEIVAQVLDALAESHAAGIIHADIKPDNVFVENLRELPFARVFDFGVARIGGREDPRPEMLYGTPEYLAPEIIRGHAPSPASDIYAAGAMLFELLTGTTPFTGAHSQEVLACHLQMDVMPPSRARGDGFIPPAVDALTLRMLDKRAGLRGSDARALAQELRSTSRVCFPQGSRPMPAQPDPLGYEALDSEQSIASYLAVARALLEDRQPARAAAELEQAVTLLCSWLDTDRAPSSTWRVFVTLAALYAHLGDMSRARRLAEVGYEQAVAAACEVGEERAKALLSRLGTTQPTRTTTRTNPLD